MPRESTILGLDGRPIVVADLDREIGAATVMGVRKPSDSNLSAGITPQRLANLLMAAKGGDPAEFLNLAEEMEERDGHYASVLGTRKRAVTQLSIKIEDASDSARDKEIGDHFRKWLKRGRLQNELFDILDAVGKSISFTELVWDKSKIPWMPAKLLWRQPSWFQFDRNDWETPRLRDDSDADGLELTPAKWIVHRHPAKSGLTVRSGVGFICAWTYLLQLLARTDWAAFVNIYGQPIRLGKYPPGTGDDDRRTLMRAVASIGADAAAIFPSAMTMELIQPGKAGGEAFKAFLDYLHQTTSKVVLGQTATTDAIAGGHAVGQEHNLVRGDIRDADAVLLATTLQEQLVDIWTRINFADAEPPRISIDYEGNEDVKATLDGAFGLADRGVRVSAKQLRDKLNLVEPAAGDEVVGAIAVAPAAEAADAPSARDKPKLKLVAKNVTRREIRTALNAASAAQRLQVVQDEILAALEAAGQPAIDGWLERIEEALNAADTMEDFARRMMDLYPELEVEALSAVMGQALALANVAARDLDA